MTPTTPRERAQQIVEAIEAIEWSDEVVVGDDADFFLACFGCGGSQRTGHYDPCPLNTVLSHARALAEELGEERGQGDGVGVCEYCGHVECPDPEWCRSAEAERIRDYEGLLEDERRI